MNKFAHCGKTPYALVVNGLLFGCYEIYDTAKGIARAMVRNGEARNYVIRDLKDRVMDSSD